VIAYRLVANGLPLVRLQSSAGDGDWLLDTGAAGGFSIPSESSSVVRFASPPVDGWPAWNNQRGITHTRVGRSAQTFTLGNVQIPQPVVTIDPGLPYPQMGMRVLQHYRVELDLTRHRARFTSARSEPIVLGGLRTTGVNIAWRDGDWHVVDVVPGSPAAALDVEVGDIVSQINELPTSTGLANFENADDANRFPVGHELWRGIGQPPSDTLAVALRRNGRSEVKRIPLFMLP
jgi:hypothetical protein